MNYHSLRWKIYRQELAQLASAIRDLGIFIAAVCYQLIIPLFLILPIFWVGQIAQSTTVPNDRALYQGGYLILTYALMRIQAKAILGSAYSNYLNSLIVSRWQKVTSHIQLSLVAGNLMLLSPIVVCCYIPDFNTLVSHRFLVFFTLTTMVVSQIAVFRQRLPLISLIFLPLLGYANEYSSNWLNLFWLISSIIELVLIDRFFYQKAPTKLRHYIQLILLFCTHRLANIAARSLATILLVAIIYYFLLQRPDLDDPLIDWLLICPLALFIGSYQFEIERFRGQYQYYLLTLPITAKQQRQFETIPLLIFSVLPISLGVGLLNWHWLVALMQLIVIGITAWGVHAWGRFYFVATLISSGLLLAIT